MSTMKPLIDYKTRGKQILQLITNHAMVPEYSLEERIFNLELFKGMVDVQLILLREELSENGRND